MRELKSDKLMNLMRPIKFIQSLISLVGLMVMCSSFCQTNAWAAASTSSIDSTNFIGIEIGGSGVKGFVYKLEIRNNEERLVGKPMFLKEDTLALGGKNADSKSLGVVSALSENTIPQQTMKQIARNVADIFSEAMLKKMAKPENVYIVGSSSIEQSRNVGELMMEINKAIEALNTPDAKRFLTLISYPFIISNIDFISAEQEGVLTLIDAIDKVGLDDVNLSNAVLFDIGAGNTKLAYMVEDHVTGRQVARTYEIPYGTDSIWKMMRNNRTECPQEYALCPLLLDEDVFADFKSRTFNAAPAFFEAVAGDYKNVLLVGGTLWAVSKLTHLNQGCAPFTQLTIEDFSEAYHKVATMEAVMRAQFGKKELSHCDVSLKSAEKSMRLVLKQYAQKNDELKAGISLIGWILATTSHEGQASVGKSDAEKQQRRFLVPNEQNDWLRSYLAWRLGKLPDIRIPEYMPKITRRSFDIQRESGF